MRLDLYLVVQGFLQSRQRAKNLIESGSVCVDGVTVTKPSFLINENDMHDVVINDLLPYVGRGGLKLEAALDAFRIDPTGKIAVDIGASTGGFSDCLLQRGAAHVFAIDAGENQLAQKLREDSRVTSIEHLNARSLQPSHIDGNTVDLVVMDVSFISATYILPQIPALLCEGGAMVCLIKPQFEVGRAMLGKGGIVKDRAAHEAAILRVFECAQSVGLNLHDLIVSPITGGDGNREFLAYLSNGKTNTPLWTRLDIRCFVKNL